MSEIAKAKQRVRTFFRDRPQFPRREFCRRANLGRNTLYGVESPSWNPTADTLDKCLSTIEAIEKEEAKAKSRPPKSELRSAFA